MTAVSKIVYIDKLSDIVSEYNNTYHRTIKMKPIDVKDNTLINFAKEVNDKDPKLQVGERVRISKYKIIFAKGYTPNWSEKVFVIKKVKNTVAWTYAIKISIAHNKNLTALLNLLVNCLSAKSH